jgi:hypothetical protein
MTNLEMWVGTHKDLANQIKKEWCWKSQRWIRNAKDHKQT